jgi:hypothetical protein
MTKKYPGGMTLTQWKRTPFRLKHQLVGLAINNEFLFWWRDCKNARCRRARGCQDYTCHWRRMSEMPSFDEQLALRGKLKPWEKLLWIGLTRGSDGMSLY